MLRLLVLILLLLNVAYLSWGQDWLLPYGWGPNRQRESERLAQQIRPQALVILSVQNTVSAAVPATPESPASR